MEWKTNSNLLLLLTLLSTQAAAVLQLTPDYLITDGTQLSQGQLAIAARWPVYDYFSGSNLELNITHPYLNYMYFRNTLEINISVTGGTPNVCYYKVNGGLWNTCTCGNPLCGSGRTFVEGENTLTVQATDGYSTASDTIIFYVFTRKPEGLFYEDLIMFLYVGSLILCSILILSRRRKKRKKREPLSYVFIE